MPLAEPSYQICNLPVTGTLIYESFCHLLNSLSKAMSEPETITQERNMPICYAASSSSTQGE